MQKNHLQFLECSWQLKIMKEIGNSEGRIVILIGYDNCWPYMELWQFVILPHSSTYPSFPHFLAFLMTFRILIFTLILPFSLWCFINYWSYPSHQPECLRTYMSGWQLHYLTTETRTVQCITCDIRSNTHQSGKWHVSCDTWSMTWQEETITIIKQLTNAYQTSLAHVLSRYCQTNVAFSISCQMLL